MNASKLEINTFIANLPKAELHMHIEGSFEPDLMFEIAKRNKISLPYKTIDEIKAAYEFSNLQDFLDIYYHGASVLITEEDFFDLTYQYLKRAHEDMVVHAEIFFDPQSHTERGIKFETVITGISNAMKQAEIDFGISSFLIMSFLRHLSEKAAIEILEKSKPWHSLIIGLGLDSTESGNPPHKFEKVFKIGKKLGFKLMAHAGEEGPAQYVEEAIEYLKIDRIDHGNRCLDNPILIKKIKALNLALTVCPLSNLKLHVVDDLKKHPIKTMLDLSLKATINSDDPAYFGGYINKNYVQIAHNLNLTIEEITQLAKNSIDASFLEEDKKNHWMQIIENYYIQSKN